MTHGQTVARHYLIGNVEDFCEVFVQRLAAFSGATQLEVFINVEWHQVFAWGKGLEDV